MNFTAGLTNRISAPNFALALSFSGGFTALLATLQIYNASLTPTTILHSSGPASFNSVTKKACVVLAMISTLVGSGAMGAGIISRLKDVNLYGGGTKHQWFIMGVVVLLGLSSMSSTFCEMKGFYDKHKESKTDDSTVKLEPEDYIGLTIGVITIGLMLFLVFNEFRK